SIVELLAKSDTGCLTLTGPGGTGKTRLAIHAANAAVFPDGVFYVPLASVRSGREVVPAIVSALELSGPLEPEKLLLAFLRARRRPRARALAAGEAAAPRQIARAAHRHPPRSPRAPADAARRARLEPRAARARRAGVLPQARNLHRQLSRGGRGRRGGRRHA